MANSVHQDRQGPDWPLGNIAVPVPGTPVSIMSLVDSTLKDAPENATASNTAEYTHRAQQIIFQAYKSGGTRLAVNTGLIYIVRKALAGAGGVADLGTIVAVLSAGQTFILGSAALSRNVYNLYRYLIDADTAGDACQVTAVMQ